MSTNSNQDQEIDLTQVFKKIGGFFDGIAMAIFKGILFVKKNILIFIVLFILGAGLGYFMDTSQKNYDNEIIAHQLIKKIIVQIDLIKSICCGSMPLVGRETPKKIGAGKCRRMQVQWLACG